MRGNPGSRTTSCEVSLFIFVCLFSSFWSTVVPFALKSMANSFDDNGTSTDTRCGWKIYGDPAIYRSQTVFDLAVIFVSLFVSGLALFIWFLCKPGLLIRFNDPRIVGSINRLQRNIIRGCLAIVTFDLITALPVFLGFLMLPEVWYYPGHESFTNVVAAVLFIPMTLQPVLRIVGISSLDSGFRQNLVDLLVRRIRLEDEYQPTNVDEQLDTIAGNYSVKTSVNFDEEETEAL